MNIPRYPQIEGLALIQFIATRKLQKTVKSMNRLVYHLGRCKKQEDKGKLLVMIAIYIVMIVKLTLMIIEGFREMCDLLIPPLPQKPQLLIENL